MYIVVTAAAETRLHGMEWTGIVFTATHKQQEQQWAHKQRKEQHMVVIFGNELNIIFSGSVVFLGMGLPRRMNKLCSHIIRLKERLLWTK